jgi:hypothetical protein
VDKIMLKFPKSSLRWGSGSIFSVPALILFN